jgi:DNA-binding transcriptional ArsR family regulator
MAAKRSTAARVTHESSSQARTPRLGDARSGQAAPHAAHSAHPAHPTHLDRVIHDRTRLAIMSALAVNEVLSFNELKAITETTDGNLSVHARKLEDAGYVLCEKSFAGRTPRTDYKLSASGKRALEKYLDHMDALIRATRKQR